MAKRSTWSRMHAFKKVTMAILAATALFTGCIARSAEPVSGKLYVTSEGDVIGFRTDGKTAVEMNGNPGVAYAGQAIYFGADGNSPRTECTYKQGGAKIALTCEGAAEAVFMVNNDGSLTGPPEGMWKQTAFAYLKLLKQKK